MLLLFRYDERRRVYSCRGKKFENSAAVHRNRFGESSIVVPYVAADRNAMFIQDDDRPHILRVSEISLTTAILMSWNDRRTHRTESYRAYVRYAGSPCSIGANSTPNFRAVTQNTSERV